MLWTEHFLLGIGIFSPVQYLSYPFFPVSQKFNSIPVIEIDHRVTFNWRSNSLYMFHVDNGWTMASVKEPGIKAFFQTGEWFSYKARLFSSMYSHILIFSFDPIDMINIHEIDQPILFYSYLVCKGIPGAKECRRLILFRMLWWNWYSLSQNRSLLLLNAERV